MLLTFFYLFNKKRKEKTDFYTCLTEYVRGEKAIFKIAYNTIIYKIQILTIEELI